MTTTTITVTAATVKDYNSEPKKNTPSFTGGRKSSEPYRMVLEQQRNLNLKLNSVPSLFNPSCSRFAFNNRRPSCKQHHYHQFLGSTLPSRYGSPVLALFSPIKEGFSSFVAVKWTDKKPVGDQNLQVSGV
jgi:hypothetical protein